MSGIRPLAVALFNDNADIPHVGCLAVSDAHRRMLRRAGLIVRHAYFQRDWQWLAGGTLDEGIAAALASPELLRVFDEVDAVVVNGEGTIHHRQGWYLVAILGAAQRLGVPTVLVNAVLQDVDAARGILSNVHDLTVRDAASAAYLQSLGVRHRIVPDSFFEAAFVDERCRDFTGRLVITDSHPVRTAEFAPALSELRATWRTEVAEYPLEGRARVADWPHAVADMRGAYAMVTGRHHGACLALAAGVPFVTLPSNTWKIEGLIDTLDGYPADARDASRPLPQRVEAAVEARAWFEAAAERLRGRTLSTFDRVRAGVGDAPARHLSAMADHDAHLAPVVASITPPGGVVLHAGCGTGALVEALQRHGLTCVGTDVSVDRENGILVPATPYQLPFADDAFDTAVVSAGWLEHLELTDVPRALHELARVSAAAAVVTTDRPHRAARAAAEPAGVCWQPLFAASGWTVAETRNDCETSRVTVMKKEVALSALTR